MANCKEVKARIKINKLLEQANWRFFDNEKGQANISLEPNVKLTQKDIDAFGEDFESTKNGFIDFIVEVVDPKKYETILDRACGTAGFLISAYKHILKQNKEIPLTPDEKLKLMNNLAGYDISPDMVKLALVNMYLHGFPEPKIHEYDSLTSEKRWDETFDVILANPPFMTPKGGISPHKRFTIQCKKAEALFVDYIIEHLNINGKAGVVVPDGIVANPSNLYVRLRELAIKNGLYAVVSLHDTVFKPYAGAKTSVLFFDKAFAKKSKDIIFIKANNGGYEKGEQRRKIEQNDLPETIKLITNFKGGERELNSEIDFIIVPKDNLNKKFSLFVNKYLISSRENGSESVEISTLFDIQKGTLQSTKKTEGEFDFITAAQEWSTHNLYTYDCEALIFAFGAAGSLGRTHYVNGKFIASDLCFILTPKKDSKYPVNLSFYHTYLNAIREQIVADLAKGVSKLAINKTEFSNYLIDYVSIEKQNEFGNKIIDERKKIAEMKAKVKESEENIKEFIFEIL